MTGVCRIQYFKGLDSSIQRAVAVYIRRGSPGFGKRIGINLSDENRLHVFMPEGFAHGFCVRSAIVYVLYKCTTISTPEDDGGILWSISKPLLSDKYSRYPCLAYLPAERLPLYETLR